MSGKIWSRRDMLKWGLGAGVTTAVLESVGNMIHVPGWNSLLTGSNQPFPQWWVKDSFELTRRLGQTGTAAQLASLFQLQQAQASGKESEWSLVTIKIFDQVHTPLVFALGKLTADGKNTMFANNEDHPALNKAAESKKYLKDNGVTDLSTDPRLAGLRFNRWFGDILNSGTLDGKALDTTSKNASDFGEFVTGRTFPADVAIQTGIGLQRYTGFAVHNLTLTKIRPSLCDVNHMAGYKGLVQSPLGITAFMMGDQYDANGGVEFNVVYSGLTSSELVRFEVTGRSVSSIVNNIDQSLSGGFGDYRPVDGISNPSDELLKGKNLSYVFDKISVIDPKRRKAILESRDKVIKTINQFRALGKKESEALNYKTVFKDLLAEAEKKSTKPEDQMKMFRESIGASQAYFNSSTKKATSEDTKQEFLSQCAFVANALKIEGNPYRNFSLFLNVNDLDGSNIDVPVNGIASSYNALNYVEGMRQLAMGLNILAKAISSPDGKAPPKKVIVMVVSDGGRTRNMGDGSGSCFAMLMGPKMEGGLDDALHGPLKVLNSDAFDSNSALQKLGEVTEGLEWDSGDMDWGLMNNNHTKYVGQAMVGDWQVGVLQFLAETQGRNIMAAELERYVKFKRYKKT